MFSTVEQLREQVADLARVFEPATLDASGSVRVLAEFATMQRLLDGMIAQCAKRVGDTNAHARTADANGAALAARLVGVEPSRMHAAVATATALESLPATAEAVRAGKLSAREAELIATAAVAHPEAEAQLLATVAEGLPKLKQACVAVTARGEDPKARRERMYRARGWESFVGPDGLYHGRLTVAPEVGAQIDANISRDVQAIFRARRRGGDHEPLRAYAADALCAYLGIAIAPPDVDDVAPVSAPTPSPSPSPALATAPVAKSTNATVHVLIDHQTLTSGELRDDFVCEIPGVGPVDVEWVRSLLGTAFLTAVIRKGKDITTVAHLGRHVPAELQTALIVNGRECCVEGCHARHYLERDHTFDHAKGGPTSLENLDWLCSYHHRCKTSRKYQLGPKDPLTNKRTLTPPHARTG